MSVLLQISDPHFGTERPHVVDALRRLHAQVHPDVVVVSGDITQRARRAQFDAARRFLDSLPGPALLVVPGNHDIPLFNIPGRVFAPYAGYTRAFGAPRDLIFDADAWRIVCLVTTRPWRHKHGELSVQQIDAVAREMASARPLQLRVVVTHHPLAVVTASDRRNLVRGREDAIERWIAAGVDLVLGGHIHLPYVTACALPGTGRPLVVAQAGTAVSGRIRDEHPNSVTVVRATPESAIRRAAIEQWNYDGPAEAFTLARATPLEFASG